MSTVEIISAVLGLSTVVLAGRNSEKNFWVGYAYNIFLFILFLHQHLYAAMAVQPISFAINAYGHHKWTHPSESERSLFNSKKLKVSGLSKNQWVGLLLIVLLSASVLGFVLEKKTSDPSPWLDSFLLMFTLFAQYLSAQKCWECWVVWIVINAANIWLYISAGLVAMPVVAGLYLINGVWSLITWFRLYKKEGAAPEGKVANVNEDK